MIKETIEHIEAKAVEAAEIKYTEIDGRLYTKDKITQIKAPIPPALCVSSLSGIIDYIDDQAEVDQYEPSCLLAQVEHHGKVCLFGPAIQLSGTRPTLLQADCDVPLFRFDHYHVIDEFIVALQSRFIKTDTQQDILKFVSSLSHDQSASYEDDGVSQKVAVKKGITQKQQLEVPNPVVLVPYRTFPEIDQPASSFVFRIKLNQGGEPLCCLTEADGGAWRLEARKNIKEWLVNKAPEITVIA